MRLWLSAAILLLSSTIPASSQVAEFSVGGGTNTINGGDLSVGGGEDYSIEGGWRMNFRITLNNWRFFGHEFGYAYNRLKFRVGAPGVAQQEIGTAAHQGLYHFLAYALPEGSRVRPFASGGGHFSNFIWPGLSVTQGGGETKFGLNYGAGVKVRVTDTWMVRVDARQYLTGKPFQDFLPAPTGGSLRQNEISVSLAWTL